MTVATLPPAGAEAVVEVEADVEADAESVVRSALREARSAASLAGGLLGLLLLRRRLLLGFGEVRLRLLGGLGGSRVTLGLQLVVRGGLLGGVRGLGRLSGQIGRQGGQFEGLRHRLGSVRRPGRPGDCQGAEDATGNSGPHGEGRRAAAGLPVAAYVSGVGHGNNRYQGLLHIFKKRVLRHSCSIETRNGPRVTLY